MDSKFSPDFFSDLQEELNKIIQTEKITPFLWLHQYKKWICYVFFSGFLVGCFTTSMILVTYHFIV